MGFINFKLVQLLMRLDMQGSIIFLSSIVVFLVIMTPQ